ncbi:MAG: hypothetical protein M1546_06075 [Chloroflexi bacterium]|nr:hypothetical protein [Chloroflexota bacterium]
MTAKILRQETLAATRWKRLGREFLWVVLGQATAAIGGLFGVRVLTHALSATAYGELALGMTGATLVQQILLGPIGGASLRMFAPAQEAAQVRAYVQGVQRLLAQATSVLLGFAALFSVGLGLTGNGQWLGLAVATIIFALFSGYSSTLDGMQNAACQRTTVAWHAGLAGWLRFIIAVGLVGMVGAFSHVAMVGYALASALVFASQFWFFRRRIFSLTASETPSTLAQSRQSLKSMRSYAWPLATWGLFTWAQMASDRWALQVFTSTREVGLYAVLYQLGYYPVTIVAGLMAQLVAPVFFQRAGDASDVGRMKWVYRANWLLTLASVGLAFLGAAMAAVLHGVVFQWLVAPEYQFVSWLLPGIVFSGGLFAAGQLASLYLLSATESRSLLAPKVVTAILGAAANVIGAAWLGLPGVIGAGIVFSGAYLVWIVCMVVARRKGLALPTG